ncbi:MAG TPA: GNAT family protein [Chitinophagaceae bacterium]|nr:GNAT family protein [Chitinophagaceae bacterium]
MPASFPISSGLALETKRVILRPLQPSDQPAFLQLAQEDESMWEYFSLNLADAAQLQRWMDIAGEEKQKNIRRPFTIIDKASGHITGSSSLGNISVYDKRAEIGWSWLGRQWRSTGINREAKFAMMCYAFEQLHFERIEFKTDVLNIRARKGLQHVGGKEEGVLRSHMQMWNNRRRSSVYYSVLKEEWPVLRTTIFAGQQLLQP